MLIYIVIGQRKLNYTDTSYVEGKKEKFNFDFHD